MNTENILKLADHIEGLDPSEYDQSVFMHDCGTPACIAGHAVFLAGSWDEVSEDEESEYLTPCIASRWLGLRIPKAHELFDSDPVHLDETPTPQDAARTLRHLAETGEVVWSHRREDPT